MKSGRDKPAEKPAGGRVRAARKENNQKIIVAAEQVFAEKGYDGATTQEIADLAGLPKANVHYYFRTKKDLYLAIMDSIMAPWLDAFSAISGDDDPADAIETYIRQKMELSRKRPLASRIFANEMIRGAPVLKEFLNDDLPDWVDGKAKILKKWADMGKMDDVPPAHLFFLIWAATQTYADFEVQVRHVLRKKRLQTRDYDEAADFITRIVLEGCGIKRTKNVTKTPAR